MRIVQLTPGSGQSYYCENCIRDNTLVKALRKAGHEVLFVPLYVPLTEDAPDEAATDTSMFFGGINIYLQQKFKLFRKTPRWLDRLFDSPRLLKWASRKAELTAAHELGEGTVSMLAGEHGRQVKELRRLIEYLTSVQRPDVICLSNALLAGLARRMREELSVPVICCLQDEAAFLDALGEPHRSQAWRTLAEAACEIDAFLATSRYYAELMSDRLSLPTEKVRVIYPGIEPANYP
ncbi:MAG: glycosyltransferase family 4 protein, partial [Planctomycetota bacterium]